MNANCPQTEAEKIVYEIYNNQRNDIMIYLRKLTLSEEKCQELCDNFKSKGFVSIVYIRACIKAATPIRDIENPPLEDTPSWNYYAQFIQGAKFD